MKDGFVCIDIGGTSIKYGLIDEKGELLDRQERDTEAWLGGPSLVEKAREIVDGYKKEGTIRGICISTAGMVDPQKGEVFYAGPQIPNYAGTKWKQLMEEAYGVPCEVENDVNCAGLAEAISGAGRSSNHCICLTIGTGIGGCAVIDNKVYHGSGNSAFEVGYIKVGNKSFQEQAAASVLSQRVAERKGSTPKEMNGKVIFSLAKQGDLVCMEEIDRLVDYLAQGIATICYVMNPDLVILGGGIMAQTDYMGQRLEEALDRHLIPSVRKNTHLAFAQHGNTAGMRGAFYHFMQLHPEMK